MFRHYKDSPLSTFSAVSSLTTGVIQVVVGDIYSDEDLKKHFSGVDAVVSCLGFLRSSAGVTGYTDTIKQIVSAMRSAYVKRLVVMTAYYSDSTFYS